MGTASRFGVVETTISNMRNTITNHYFKSTAYDDTLVLLLLSNSLSSSLHFLFDEKMFFELKKYKWWYNKTTRQLYTALVDKILLAAQLVVSKHPQWQGLPYTQIRVDNPFDLRWQSVHPKFVDPPKLDFSCSYPYNDDGTLNIPEFMQK